MYSTKGRPRALTDAQVEMILQWNTLPRTQKQLAAKLGVSVGTICRAIALKGQYKQPSPEHLEAAKAANRARRKSLKSGGWL